ncbi:MAG: TonB-dependent receptor [Asticcacaulis sp.]
MSMKKSVIMAGTALIGLLAATNVFAQSTSTQTVEEVVVKGNRKAAGVLDRETGPKTKESLGQDVISLAPAGQTIAQTLNVIPGVNFTSNDPFGSSGGEIFIRGLDNSRISLTFDGVQLNDAGNYAIYTNQQLDPELIARASVSTGATDVDSMTASATGGTVNYTTRRASDDFGVTTNLSVGDFKFRRGMIELDTGKVGPLGTKAFVAYSYTTANTFTKEPSNIDGADLEKKQVNFSVEQDFDGGSFMRLMGHYNENRNRFIFGQSQANFDRFGKFYNSAGRANVNPSNTGNLRFQSKWNLSEQLTVTADASFQYVLANGGGTGSANEVTGQVGSYRNANFKGVDINKDGDALDTSVTIYNPNTTHTDRLGFYGSAIYRFNPNHTLRFNASFDRARTTQTGDGTLVNANGTPIDVFGAKEETGLGLKGKDGTNYLRRNRFSKADVDVFSAEYRGRFFDEALFLSLGVRSQKMERFLSQRCYSPVNGTGSFNPFCTTEAPKAVNADGTVTFTEQSGNFIRPYNTKVSFKKVLPSVGATLRVTDDVQVYASYSENLSSPRTDNYYAALLVNGKITPANPKPETSKNFEGGLRYSASNLNASVGIWAKDYQDRIVSSYDAATDTFFDRNVGKVEMRGWEANFGYKPVDTLSLYGSVTYTSTEVKSNLLNGEVATALGTDKVGDLLFIPTAGKSLVEVPEWMFTYGGTYTINDDLTLSLQGKYVGDRFVSDVNDAKSAAYSTWDATLRYDLDQFGFVKKGSFLQLNVINLFDEYYYGNLGTVNATQQVNTASGTRIVAAGTPNFNVGAPRTFMLTLRTKF